MSHIDKFDPKPGDVVCQTIRARYTRGISFFYGVVEEVRGDTLLVHTPGFHGTRPWELTDEGCEYRVIQEDQITKALRDHLGSILTDRKERA